MLFRTIDHYYYDVDILINKDDYCFICYDFLSESENEIPIKLNSKIYYLKNCNCDGLIHKKCLDIWYDTKFSCPICRIGIVKTQDLTTNRRFITVYLDFIYICYFNNISRIKRYLLFMFFIYFTLEFYFMNCNKHFNNYQSRHRIFNENYVGFDDIFFKNSTY